MMRIEKLLVSGERVWDGEFAFSAEAFSGFYSLYLLTLGDTSICKSIEVHLNKADESRYCRESLVAPSLG
jgi:hypothetical protein